MNHSYDYLLSVSHVYCFELSKKIRFIVLVKEFGEIVCFFLFVM